MRVLAISNFYPPHSIGGYEQYCRDVVDGLRGRGHEVEVLCSTFGVDRAVREGHVERRLPTRWGPTYQPTRRNLLAEELGMNRAMREAVRRSRPELVSIWNLYSMPYSAIAIAHRYGLPVVLHIADDWALRPDPWVSIWSRTAQRRWARAVKAVARPLVDRVLPTDVNFAAHGVHWSFISEYRKRQYVAGGVAPADSPVLYAGIPVERFLGRRRGDRAAGPTRLLFVGSIYPTKGPHVAIEALGRLADDGQSDVTLDLIGPRITPDYDESLAALVRRLGLGEKVRFLEAVERWRIPEVYAEHDVLLFTSVAPESFPLSILEAMASGLAVVSSVTGGHAEILRDGENALTYRAGDAEDLARCVRSLLDRPEEARRLAEAGRQLVRREFTLERMIDQNEQLFRQVLGRRAA